MSQLDVDPEIVQKVYQQRLHEASEQNILLTAATAQLQQQVAALTQTVEELTTKNEDLMRQTGRGDGIPPEVTPGT
jgi:hypothetical protein